MNKQPCNITATEILIRQAQIEEMNFVFKLFWAGRPKDKPLPWIQCPVYVFNTTESWKTCPWVDVGERYRPVDWRGLV